jgi:fucose permease
VAGSLIVLAFGGFIALGLGDGVLGVAWPSIAESFEAELGQLGLLIAVGTAGYLLSSLLSGRVERHLGVGRLLVVSALLAAGGLGAFALAPTWVLALIAMFVAACGAALVDAGLNAYVAVHHSVRVMHFLHASFGVGATLGPVIMGLAIGVGSGWRAGYAVLVAVQVVLVAGFVRSRRRWRSVPDVRDVSDRRPVSRFATAVAVGVFLLYTGAEVAAGQWSFTMLTVGRGVGDTVGSALVAGYWGSLTVGRVGVGVIGDRLAPRTTLVGGALLSVLGLIVLWLEVGPWAGGLGLLAAGLGFAPVFPSLVMLTPGRVGADRTTGAVGYQLAAAGAGAMVVPGAIGLIVEAASLGAVAPVLVLTAALMTVGAAIVSPRPIS